MQTTDEALINGFNWEDEPGYWSFKTDDGYELCFEPLIFDGQMYVALYKDGLLITNKVVVKPGYVKDGM